MKQRKDFYEAWMRGEDSVAELCRRFGISRKTGYKWLRRSSAGRDDDAFADRSRRPHTSPWATEAWLVDAIVAARKQRPTWGPKKLRAVLQRQNTRVELPAVSTFAAIFKRHGLIRPKRRRSRATTPYSAPLAHANAPNALWCIDFKGHFAVGTRRCYPLTITDAHSRYLIACVALKDTKTATVRRAMEGVFREFGLPAAIRSDNGEPFASTAVAGLSQLSAWWLKLGIRHERIEPGHPEQNGRHERFHLTLKQETASPPKHSMSAQQCAFDLFRAVYNDQRPHEALGMQPPACFYEPSRRVLPDPPWGRDFEYPPDVEVARVSKLGRVRATAGSFFLTSALRHERVGIEWTRAGIWKVWFGSLFLGALKRKPGRARRVEFAPTSEVLPMSSDSSSPMSLAPCVRVVVAISRTNTSGARNRRRRDQTLLSGLQDQDGPAPDRQERDQRQTATGRSWRAADDALPLARGGA